jgi:hypothetical protein
LQTRDAGAEAPADRRQGDVHDNGVKRDDEETEHRRRKGQC